MRRSIASLLRRYRHARWPHRPSSQRQPHPILVVMGATGTGKTCLSIDLVCHFSGEVLNSDKIQLYTGLDITTNKVPLPERLGVPHHLLGSVAAGSGELSQQTYRRLASSVIASICSCEKLPIVAGGSNSLIHALLSNPYIRGYSPFIDRTSSYRPGLRNDCCMIWVDVEKEVLMEYLDRRVDDMIGLGMVEELREYFKKENKREREMNKGLEMAIGLPELEPYFTGKRSLGSAMEEIKRNTSELAVVQVGKIERMRGEWRWPVKRVDATDVIRAKLRGEGKEVETERWERLVLRPCAESVRVFLRDVGGDEGEGMGNGGGTWCMAIYYDKKICYVFVNITLIYDIHVFM